MNQPDLLQQDEDNRKRALAVESFIVEAPAGAGKTELLTQRYLKLLATVSEPEEIVAITFTNKAAAEMRSRVLQSLQDAADRAPIDKPHKHVTRSLAEAALSRSAELGWDLLAQPGRLRINTIDSLSSNLARQMPLMSRFGAQPGVSDDADKHYLEAARRTLAMLEEEAGQGAVTEALRWMDNDVTKLEKLLADMLAKRDQWQHRAGQSSMRVEVEAALGHLVQHELGDAAAMLSPKLQQQLMPVARFAADNLPDDNLIAQLRDWTSPLQAIPRDLPLWRSVCDLLMTNKNEFRKEGGLNARFGFPATDNGRNNKQMLLGVIGMLHDEQPLARIRKLPDAEFSDHEQTIVESFSRMLQLAAAQLWTVFQEAGEVDFVEVSQRALGALIDETGATDLAMRLDYRIQHVLVDEFQDTSPMQVELLRRLTQGWEPEDGRTLFCVGDPMQSIYRFRKADVGLFLQAAEFGIGHLKLQSLNLARNNRSCPAVVSWINQAFAKVFPEHDDEVRGAIRYRTFVATRESHDGEGVFAHPLVLDRKNASLTPDTVEAQHVAELIAQEQAAYPKRKIAVLVRARNHLVELVAEIRRHRPHLRFQAVEIEQLSGRQAVQDVLSLTHALFHRADRVHWLAILRAPWCGLVLADLHALAADDHHATLWQLMQDEARLATLSDDGRKRLLHVRNVIAEAFAHQGRQSARRWVESVWLSLAGPHCLWEAGDVRDVQAFFDLIEKLETGGRFDLAQLEVAMEKLYAAPDVQADETLQFMTIHKSKGLEFDTVILPGLHRAAHNKDQQLLMWEEIALDEAGEQLIAAPLVPKHKRGDLPSVYDYLQGLEKERSSNEDARALYVAATRAERRLHLVGVVTPDAKDERKPRAHTFLHLLWDSVGADFLNAKVITQAGESEALDESQFVPQLIRFPQPVIPDLLKSVATSVASVGANMEAAELEHGNLDTDCGTLAHLYMEMIAGSGLDEWNASRVEAVLPAMQRWLAQRGHAEDAAITGAQRVASAITTTLASEHGRWILQARPDAASELALASADGTRVATHVVDRTFVEDGVRWVIDYKSAALDTAEGEQQVERYRAQLERYAALFEYEGLPVRKAVFFMASGKLVQLA